MYKKTKKIIIKIEENPAIIVALFSGKFFSISNSKLKIKTLNKEKS